jgi:hypothetical protein
MEEVSVFIQLVERLGVPIVVLGFAGWYIKFLQDAFSKEREAMRKQEIHNDDQLFDVVKSTSDALIEMKTALAEQTATMRELLATLRR